MRDKLAEKSMNLWRFLKDLQANNLLDDDVPLKCYVFSLIDKDTSSLVEILEFKSSVIEVKDLADRKRCILRLSSISESEQEILADQVNKKSVGLLFVSTLDQYHHKFGPEFIVVVK